jgi:hypothetical protein
MKRLFLVGLSAALAASLASEAFAWGAVRGPAGGAAYRGPMGGAAVRGPAGGARSSRRRCVSRAGGRGRLLWRRLSSGAGGGGDWRRVSYPPSPYYRPSVVVAAPACGYYPYPSCY